MSQPLITITNIDKIYPKKEGRHRVEVLKDINLTICEKDFLVLLGPSGCGKSTLLRIIANLDTQTRGTINWHNPIQKKDINFVFQDFGIFPWLSVFDNVALGLIGRGVEKTEIHKRVHAILEHFEIVAFKDNFPRDLSGGMRQRVGLARAFVTEPKVIFLDEPFSELDFATAELLRNSLLELWQKNNTTVIMVSHYIDEAVSLANKIAIFSHKPSSIVRVIDNMLPRPRQHRSQEFFTIEDDILTYFPKI